ncbi:KpsF/GutQ family sugar-phosphate isomerase [bacterium]|nr:MAG: KpsF/GutQ family sugar-phosphate isomerase [bacterium]
MCLEIGRRVLRQEAEAIFALADSLDHAFERAAQLILGCTGRVVTCGIGKSGHIARKTAGTLASTGTPSLFLHAAEAVHGDLGMVTEGDVVLLYSHSGETDELIRLFPSLRLQGARTILLTGRRDSSGARLADVVLDTGVLVEACPNNLAPTTSTTAMLALSDALAVGVMERRGFGKDEFARFHPKGALGKRLLLRIEDVMRPLPDIAVVSPETTMFDAMWAVTKAGVGAACVVVGGALVGFISDGDLRRHALEFPDLREHQAQEIMNRNVTTIPPGLLAVEALEAFQMNPRPLGEMPVVDADKRLLGLLMLKDLLRSGIV